MNDRQSRTLDKYTQITNWFALHKTPIAPEAPSILERLHATINEIDATRATQDSIATQRKITGARAHLDRMRQEQMLPLGRMTRRIFAGEPALQKALRVPHKRAHSEIMLAAAQRMIDTLEEHRELLTRSRVDVARIDKLQRDTQRVRKLFESSGALVADRAVPTHRLKELFKSAHEDVSTLQALVAARNPREMPPQGRSLWRIKKRIGRPRAPRKPS